MLCYEKCYGFCFKNCHRTHRTIFGLSADTQTRMRKIIFCRPPPSEKQLKTLLVSQCICVCMYLSHAAFPGVSKKQVMNLSDLTMRNARNC